MATPRKVLCTGKFDPDGRIDRLTVLDDLVTTVILLLVCNVAKLVVEQVLFN